MFLTKKYSFASAVSLLAGISFGESSPVTYTFPTTDYREAHKPRQYDGGFVHALCVLGAKDAKASVSPNREHFTYTPVPDFRDGVQVFKKHGHRWQGVNGNGAQVCEGGIYLMPLDAYALPSGEDVTVEATAVDETDGVTVCALIIDPFIGTDNKPYDNSGNWGPLLVEQGFTVGDAKPYYWRFPYTSYCKQMKGTATKNTPPTDSICVRDIKLTRTDGVTEFPLGFTEDSPIPAVNIVEQDSTTVTVELNNAWDVPIDKYFIQYKENKFRSKCHEVDGVNPGDLIETITIQCLVRSPMAYLKICLQDNSGSLLPNGDDASISDCCYSDAPEGTPAVCYHLEIMCESECNQSPIRNLRALTA